MIIRLLGKIINLKLHWQIFIAFSVGILAGSLTGEETTIGGVVRWYAVFDFLGVLFIRALRMIIVPLLTSSIITGVSGVGSSGSIGKIGGKTFLYYITTSLLAILTGLILVNFIAPGLENGVPVRDKLGLMVPNEEFIDDLQGAGANSLIEIFVRMIPTNPIKSAVDGDVLPIIFFCILFGYLMSKLPPKLNDVLNSFWEGIFDVMMGMTNIIMKFAPFGVFGLIAKIVASTGFDAFIPLMRYFITVLVGLAIHFFITLPLILILLGRVKPTRHIRAMLPALVTAFSTSSSSATLPLTMKCSEKNVGISNRITSFVLPLGATVNMDGTALYECVAAIFISQAYGIDLGFPKQFVIVLTSLLASIGAAGIPSAGLVMMTIVLKAVGLPLEGVGLILAVDRVLDMTRTMVNVYSDSCGAVVIARSEGETDLLTH